MSSRIPAGRGFPSLEEIRGGAIAVRKGQEKEARRLAFDLSVSCVGWALDVGGEISRWGKFVFKKEAKTGEKLVFFEDLLCALFESFRPTSLLVEKPLSRKGNVTRRHNELIGILRLSWWKHANREIPESAFIPATTVKASLGVPAGVDHADNKRIMVEEVNRRLGLSLHYHRDSRLQSDDDAADAIAVLLATRKPRPARRRATA